MQDGLLHYRKICIYEVTLHEMELFKALLWYGEQPNDGMRQENISISQMGYFESNNHKYMIN